MATVTEESIARLPNPVGRSLLRSGVVDTEIPESVTVTQEGRIRTSADRKWLRFVARETYTLDPPGFEWDARLKMAGVTVGRAVDSLCQGRGAMKVKLLGLATIVDESGPEMDQGARMRWLNETMWFPSVWASDVMVWKPIDEGSAVGSMRIGGEETAGEFRFDEEGRLVDFRADRYRSVEEGFVLEPWSTPLTDHQRFGGIEVPSAGSAVWSPGGDDLEYIQIRVTDVRDITTGYGDRDGR